MLGLRMIALAGVLGVSAHVAMADDGVGEITTNKDQIAISGNGYVRTFPCEGRRVVIEGTQHNITLTGTCAGLELNGAENKVALTLAPKAVLAVAGIQQTVVWRSSAEPQQRISGVGHKIQRAN
ncbi:DUF3060 domain-containing protein [Duganella sp. P38]|jgi:hypothetical protein|uniref:DUF3060 domain-containing protein n=1 Tax=Duganella sp. P38 TaxID=3423949 RepID=UPI003D792B97